MVPRRSSVFAVPLAAIALLVALVVPAAAAPPGTSRIDLPDGWAPEGITTGPGTTVFVGSLVNGAVWKADVRTGEGAVLVPGVDGNVAVGTFFTFSSSTSSRSVLTTRCPTRAPRRRFR